MAHASHHRSCQALYGGSQNMAWVLNEFLHSCASSGSPVHGMPRLPCSAGCSPGRASSPLHSHCLLYTDSWGTTLPCVSDPSQHVQDCISVWLMRRALKCLILAAVEKCCKHSCNWSALKNWFCVKQQRKFTLHFVAQECLQGLRGKIRGTALSWQHFSFIMIWRANVPVSSCVHGAALSQSHQMRKEELHWAPGAAYRPFLFLLCSAHCCKNGQKATNICRRGKVKHKHKKGNSVTQVTKTERTGDYLCCALSVLRTGDSRDNTKASLLWIYELRSHFVVTALSKSLFVPAFL